MGKGYGGSTLCFLFLSGIVASVSLRFLMLCASEIRVQHGLMNFAWMCCYTWRSVYPLTVPCYSNITKIKERVFWSGIMLIEAEPQISIWYPEKEGGGFIKEYAHPPPNSFRICLRKRWRILICPDLSQKSLPAACSGTKDQARGSNFLWTSKSPRSSGWPWKRERETGKLRPPCW